MLKKKNVLQLRSSLGFFGAENVILELAKGLSETEYRPIIGILKNRRAAREELAEVARRHNITAVEFECRGPVDPATVAAIGRYVRENDVRIIHSHGYKADFYAQAIRQSGVATVATCHTWTEVAYSFKARCYTWLDKLILRRFDSIVAISDGVRNQLLDAGLPAANISVIYNGIDVHRFGTVCDPIAIRDALGLPSSRVTVGTIGRLVQEKAHILLLQAAKELRDQFPNLLYIVVGDGPLREQLTSEAAALGLEHHFVFLGTRDCIPEILAAIDLFVLPSISEGLPMVLLEAMASKKPIIATRVGAISSVITNGETGILIEPNPIQIAKAISQLLSNPRQAACLAQNAYCRVSREFSAGAMTHKYAQVYKQTLSLN